MTKERAKDYLNTFIGMYAERGFKGDLIMATYFMLRLCELNIPIKKLVTQIVDSHDK